MGTKHPFMSFGSQLYAKRFWKKAFLVTQRKFKSRGSNSKQGKIRKWGVFTLNIRIELPVLEKWDLNPGKRENHILAHGFWRIKYDRRILKVRFETSALKK